MSERMFTYMVFFGSKGGVISYRKMRTIAEYPIVCLKHFASEFFEVAGVDLESLPEGGVYTGRAPLPKIIEWVLESIRRMYESDEIARRAVLEVFFVDNGEDWALKIGHLTALVIDKASIASTENPQEMMYRVDKFVMVNRFIKDLKKRVIEEIKKKG